MLRNAVLIAAMMAALFGGARCAPLVPPGGSSPTSHAGPCASECDEPDNDRDGVDDDADCDDTDPTVHPGAPELCDGQDNNCDDVVPANEADNDGDGWTTCEGDDNDGDTDVYPGAPELCDDIDNDCDGELDEGCNVDGCQKIVLALKRDGWNKISCEAYPSWVFFNAHYNGSSVTMPDGYSWVWAANNGEPWHSRCAPPHTRLPATLSAGVPIAAECRFSPDPLTCTSSAEVTNWGGCDMRLPR